MEKNIRVPRKRTIAFRMSLYVWDEIQDMIKAGDFSSVTDFLNQAVAAFITKRKESKGKKD